MALIITTQPTEEPVDVAEAKRHLRLSAGEDVQVALLIEAARERCERELDRAIMATTAARLPPAEVPVTAMRAGSMRRS